jgi:hypothetical protein
VAAVNEYLQAIALLLERAGAHPRVDSDPDWTDMVRSAAPGVDGLLERESIGWRPFMVERADRVTG